MAKDGGSACCFRCDPKGRFFHECPRNPNAVAAPDGKRYKVGHPGPSLCRVCNPRRNKCFCPWCDGPILDRTDDGNAVCLRCPGGWTFHKCPLNPAGVEQGGVVYSTSGPGKEACAHCKEWSRQK